MTIGGTMETYEARLASFSAAHPPTKKRTSSASNGKTLKWPHENPSPPQLARAGFFYRPTSLNPDNTTCYLCKTNLDGWEENDNAVEEHLKHAPKCGWAITFAIELEIEDGSQIQEDPLSERMLDARKMTFGSKWPHENKRGWKCSVQKLIEAGWYYCPTSESEDFVKCSYCSLGLDGWEPKDNPRDEHERRSPGCVFFGLSSASNSKAGRSKRSRASKALRMSTQSNFTTVSEGVSVADAEAHGDDSIMSVVRLAKVTKPGKGARKGAISKKPAALSRRQASKAMEENTQVASSFLEPEDDDFEVKVETAPTQRKGNRKRKSEEISTKSDVPKQADTHHQEQESQDQPKKRRATRTRDSTVRTRNTKSPIPQEEHDYDAQISDSAAICPPVPPQGQKKGEGGNKRGASNVRKPSTAPIASKASLRTNVPPEEEIDAALEAELDRPLTDEEGDLEPSTTTKHKGRRLTRTKPGSRKAAASVAPTRRTTRASTITNGDSSMQDIYPSLPPDTEGAHVLTPVRNEHTALANDHPEQSSAPEHQKKAKVGNISEPQKTCKRESGKAEEAIATAEDKTKEEMPTMEPQEPQEPQEPRIRQASGQLSARNTRVSEIPSSSEAMDLVADINTPVLGMQTAADSPKCENDPVVEKQPRTKRGGKKAPAKKVKAGKKAAMVSQNTEDIVQPVLDDASLEVQSTHSGPVDDHIGRVEFVSVEVGEPKKQQEPSSQIAEWSKTKQTLPETLPEPEAFAPESPAAPLMGQPISPAAAEIPRISPQPLSAYSALKPASSPQSSDAENQPPSSRQSKVHQSPSMQSPSKSHSTRPPLALSTPVSSPSKNNISRLQTTFPWTAIEMEHIFEGTEDKENSPFAFGEAGKGVKSLLTSPEKRLTVEQWVQFNAQRGEEKLRNECERLVGKFEDQGVRALRVLEGIVCTETL